VKIILAIDPGANGGLAVDYWGRVEAWKLAPTEAQRVDDLRQIVGTAEAEGCDVIAVIERVGGHVGRPQPGSDMFNFGRGVGNLIGALHYAEKLTGRVWHREVAPQVWQKIYGLGKASACASQSEWKRKLKAEAQRRFPHLNITLATADALLILEWARLLGEGLKSHGNPPEEKSHR
jgi:hypothetical protein